MSRAKRKVFKNFYDLEVQGISQSSMRNFMSCRRKWMLSIAGLQRKDTQRNTHFGSIVHEMLDLVYQNIDTLKLKDLNEFITLELEKYLEKHQDEIFIPSDQYNMEKAMAIAITEGYFRYFRKDRDNFLSIKPEYEFAVPYKGVTLRGKVDGISELKNHELWQIEHKTKSRVDEEGILAALQFDFQNLMYSFILDMTNDELIKGVIYNVIRKPQLRQGKDESPKSFFSRIKADIKSRQDWYYNRYEIVYSKKDKIKFKKQLDGILKEIKLFIAGELPDIQNPAHCLHPFKCEFLNFCSSGCLTGLHIRETLHPELDIELPPNSAILEHYGIDKTKKII